MTFIHPDDLDLHNAWDSRAFELQVANHELLGHGSGKLFQEAADGSKNFDPQKASSARCCDFKSIDLLAGHQSTHRKAHVSEVHYPASKGLIFFVVRHGISLAKPRTLSLGRFLPPWKSVVPKLWHSIVSLLIEIFYCLEMTICYSGK